MSPNKNEALIKKKDRLLIEEIIRYPNPVPVKMNTKRYE
jgi:hypothetical protein